MGRHQVDIQELTDRDAFLDRLVSSAVNGVYVYDLALQRNVYVSPRYTEITGYTLDEINAKKDGDFLALFHPEELKGVLAHMGGVADLADGERSALQYRFRTKAGKWVWLAGHDVPFERAPDGTLKRFMGSFVDITGEKRAQSDLEHFAHLAGHELRAPARRIRMYADLLKELNGDDLDPDTAEILEIMESESTRLETFLSELSSLTGLTSDREIERAPLDLNAVISGVVAELASLAESREANFEFEPHLSVSANQSLMGSLYRNLAGNALKHAKAQPTVRFTCAAGAEGPVFGVYNTKSSIAPEHCEQAFIPFRRLGATAKGSGLGLSICARIVAHHGGRIWLESGDDWTHVQFSIAEA